MEPNGFECVWLLLMILDCLLHQLMTMDCLLHQLMTIWIASFIS